MRRFGCCTEALSWLRKTLPCFSCVLKFQFLLIYSMQLRNKCTHNPSGRHSDVCLSGRWGSLITEVKAKCLKNLAPPLLQWWVMVSLLWLSNQSLSTPPPTSISLLFPLDSFFSSSAVCACTVLGIRPGSPQALLTALLPSSCARISNSFII